MGRREAVVNGLGKVSSRNETKRNISAEVRVVPLYLGLMVTPLIVGEHSLFPRLQF